MFGGNSSTDVLERMFGSDSSTGALEHALLLRLNNATWTGAHKHHSTDQDPSTAASTIGKALSEIDQIVARTILAATRDVDLTLTRTERLRTGSIGASAVQQIFYWRVAQSPAIRQICEVGFNAGHSSALWLSANPSASLATFDLFDHHRLGFMKSVMRVSLALLQSRFPGRIEAFAGDSKVKVRTARLRAPCDLVHVDGKHDYDHATWDTLNLLAQARPSVLVLVDDQCDPRGCRGPNAAFAVWSTLATCDLEQIGLIESVVGRYNTARPFALFRRGPSLLNFSTTLPCPQHECPCAWCDPAFTHAPVHAKEFSKPFHARAACTIMADGRRMVTVVAAT